ncbi:MAG: hypothetical protein ACP6IY_03385 [Promethearchaeia archaeon]
MSNNEDSEQRNCPYCGQRLKKPYWQHIQKEHPEEYEQKEMWVSLYKDYKNIGMAEEMCITIISELYNVTKEEVISFLKEKKVL